VRAQPGDIITEGGHLPALLLELRRGGEHGEVGLAGGRGESTSDVGLVALVVGDTGDEHVLSEPTLLAGEGGTDTKSKTLLAEESVTTVTRAIGDDVGFTISEVGDEGVGKVNRPSDIGDDSAIGLAEGVTDGVEARDELAISAESGKDLSAHTSHDTHVHDDVGAISDLNTDLGERRTGRTHGEGDHVHGTTSHATRERLLDALTHRSGVNPVVSGSGIILVLTADEGDVLTSGGILQNVTRIGERKIEMS